MLTPSWDTMISERTCFDTWMVHNGSHHRFYRSMSHSISEKSLVWWFRMQIITAYYQQHTNFRYALIQVEQVFEAPGHSSRDPSRWPTESAHSFAEKKSYDSLIGLHKPFKKNSWSFPMGCSPWLRSNPWWPGTPRYLRAASLGLPAAPSCPAPAPAARAWTQRAHRSDGRAAATSLAWHTPKGMEKMFFFNVCKTMPCLHMFTHVYHPPVITIFIGGVTYHSQMGSLWLFYHIIWFI